MQIRDANADDAPAILGLNEAFVEVLSPLDEAGLARLVAQSAMCRVVEQAAEVIAFLLAIREGSGYDSPNYRWFAERYPRFLYVDRVVVAAPAHGRGLGELLYREASACAIAGDVPMLACEFDIDPPNPGSQRFHARLGFREVGRQVLGAGKIVSLQVLDMPFIASLADKQSC